MTVDDSFKKPGAIPFKWEIRPGVPKIRHQQQEQQKQQPKKLSPPVLPSPSPSFSHLRRPSPTPRRQQQQQKLKPPPGGFIFLPPPEPRSRSFRSTPLTRSERWRFEQAPPTGVRPECVSPGCFPSPLLRRKDSKRRTTPMPEPDYASDLETLSRWSVSSKKSFSIFLDSPCSSFSSYQSSPRPVGDAEWAGFGLF